MLSEALNIVLPIAIIYGVGALIFLGWCIGKRVTARCRSIELNEAGYTKFDPEVGVGVGVDNTSQINIGLNGERLTETSEMNPIEHGVDDTERDVWPGGVLPAGPTPRNNRSPAIPASVTLRSGTFTPVEFTRESAHRNRIFSDEPNTQPRAVRFADEPFSLSRESQPEITATTPLIPNRPMTLLQAPARAFSIATDTNRVSSSLPPLVSGTDAATDFHGRNIAEAQLAVLAPVHPSSPEAIQIASIMQQMDDMWAAIARLRQAHLERTPVPTVLDETSDVGSSLPDYVSENSQFGFGGSSALQVHP